MTIFHVSGSAGSGKSVIGQILHAIYKPDRLYIIDLDSAFYRAYDATKRMKDGPDRAVRIEQFVRETVARSCKQYPNVALIGYSDLHINGKVHYIDLGANVKYFIDISLEDLIKQFRSRSNAQVHSRGLPKKFTDADIRRMVAQDNKAYHGYLRMPQMMIIRDIIQRMNKK